MNNKPDLHQVSFEFSQDGDCMDGEHQELDITAIRPDLTEPDCFFRLKTGASGWSIDDIGELSELIDRVKKAYDE